MVVYFELLMIIHHMVFVSQFKLLASLFLFVTTFEAQFFQKFMLWCLLRKCVLDGFFQTEELVALLWHQVRNSNEYGIVESKAHRERILAQLPRNKHLMSRFDFHYENFLSQLYPLQIDPYIQNATKNSQIEKQP